MYYKQKKNTRLKSSLKQNIFRFRLFNGHKKFTFRGSRIIPDFDAFAQAHIPDLQNDQV